MDTVSAEVCRIQHEYIEQNFAADRQRLNNHGAQLDAMEKLAAKQTSVIEGMARRMEDVDARLKTLEHKPQKRLDRVQDTIYQWAMLLALGLLAAKIGLG